MAYVCIPRNGDIDISDNSFEIFYSASTHTLIEVTTPSAGVRIQRKSDNVYEIYFATVSEFVDINGDAIASNFTELENYFGNSSGSEITGSDSIDIDSGVVSVNSDYLTAFINNHLDSINDANTSEEYIETLVWDTNQTYFVPHVETFPNGGNIQNEIATAATQVSGKITAVRAFTLGDLSTPGIYTLYYELKTGQVGTVADNIKNIGMPATYNPSLCIPDWDFDSQPMTEITTTTALINSINLRADTIISTTRDPSTGEHTLNFAAPNKMSFISDGEYIYFECGIAGKYKNASVFGQDFGADALYSDANSEYNAGIYPISLISGRDVIFLTLGVNAPYLEVTNFRCEFREL